jgi:hypothetical protein
MGRAFLERRPVRLTAMRASLFVLIAVLAACRRDDNASRSSGPLPAADASVVAPSQASPSASSSASASDEDLLHFTGASLAVSSNVDNPRDYPEHLVDARADTAWNGRSGDLAGAWISFRVPESAHVTRIEMSAGFDKKNAEGDLFTMNHRIKRVRITRGATVVREHAFDTEVRTPQSIVVDAGGGSYRIEILETLAGSKTTWREACVSELRVMGRPGDGAKTTKTAPTVGIGAFPSEAPSAAPIKDGREMSDGEKAVAPFLGRGWPTLADFCRAWDGVMDRIIDVRIKRGDESVPKAHACRVVGPLAASFKPTAETKSVTRVRVFQENWSEDRIAIETASGFFVPEGEPVEAHSFNDPGCFGSTTTTVKDVRATGASVDVILGKTWKNRRYNYDADGGVDSYSSSDDISRVNMACSFGGGSKMTCSRTDLERVCHMGTDVVPCDSF